MSLQLSPTNDVVMEQHHAKDKGKAKKKKKKKKPKKQKKKTN